MGTLTVSTFAKTGTAVSKREKRNKYFFIVLFSCKDAKNTRGDAYSSGVKMKMTADVLHCLNNLIIQNEQQTRFSVNGKDYFCTV